jgi:hypothetical protein
MLWTLVYTAWLVVIEGKRMTDLLYYVQAEVQITTLGGLPVKI